MKLIPIKLYRIAIILLLSWLFTAIILVFNHEVKVQNRSYPYDYLVKYDENIDDYGPVLDILLNSFGENNKDILFEPFNYNINSNITIPANIDIMLPNNTTLSGEKELTINGEINNPIWFGTKEGE